MKSVKINDLIARTEGPFVSIYMPTHKSAPDNKQDPTRFKNLLKEAEAKLDDSNILDKASELLEDTDFWNESTDGLGVLVDKDETFIYRLSGKVNEKVFVGDHFHILPLINYYELPNDYYFLDLSKDRFSLYSYKNGKLNEKDPDIYDSFHDLSDDKDIETEGSAPTRGKSDAVHDYHTASDIEEKERENYFRYLADELKKFLTRKDSKLILFGTTENVVEFQNMADFEIYGTIEKPFDSIKHDEVYDELKEALLPKYIKNMEERLDGLRTEIGQDRGTDNLSRIVEDSVNSRVDVLYVSNDTEKTEEIDKLVSNVLLNGGEVVVIDTQYQDFNKEAGAKYRY